ncbi:MAG TPA: response regulator transcription factor [Nitrosopumilaceae archaeon]|nr:response regulator transcription factor [Nitrosopumilaceae archaeon]
MSGPNKQEQIKTIVVDDDEDSQDSICQTLEIGGIDVIGKGSDGEQAYQLYKKLHPDIVILDMNMPNYDGGYALEKITQDYPDAKVIVVTAFTDYTFEKAKASAIVTKPYDFEPFLDTIKKVAAGKPITPVIK